MNNEKRILIVDIDGCLVKYPDEFLLWIEKKISKKYCSIDVLKKDISEVEYEELKYLYRISGVKRELPMIMKAKDVLNNIKKKGFSIWIVTSRPFFEPVISDTKYWLEKSGIIFDELFFAENKIQFLSQINIYDVKYVIDDNIDFLEYISNNFGICSFLVMNNNKNISINGNSRLKMVSDWEEIDKFFNKYLFMENY